MENVKLYDLLKLKKVIVSTLGDNLVWTDEEIFKDFAINCLIDGLSEKDKLDSLTYYSKKSSEWFVDSKDTMNNYKIINPYDIFKVSNKLEYPMSVAGNEIVFYECDVSDVEDMFYNYNLMEDIPLSFEQHNDDVIVKYSEWDEPVFNITYDELYN